MSLRPHLDPSCHPNQLQLCTHLISGRYDTDGSGNISYAEFTNALFAVEEPPSSQFASAPKSLTGKACYPDNEWLKGARHQTIMNIEHASFMPPHLMPRVWPGSNGIFEGIFGGGSGSTHTKLRPPSGPGIGGNFNRRIGQMG